MAHETFLCLQSLAHSQEHNKSHKLKRVPCCAQENMRTLQGDAAFLQVSLSHQQEVGARLDSYISESQARLEKSKQQAEVKPLLSAPFKASFQG